MQTVIEWLICRENDATVLFAHNSNQLWYDPNPVWIPDADYTVEQLQQMADEYKPINLALLEYDGSHPKMKLVDNYQYVDGFLNQTDRYIPMFEISNMAGHYVVMNLDQGTLSPYGLDPSIFEVLPDDWD